MTGGKNCERTFAKIKKQGDQKTTPAQDAACVFGADAAAANLPHILSGAIANEIISSGKTPQQIGTEAKDGGLMPVCGTQVFNPDHGAGIIYGHYFGFFKPPQLYPVFRCCVN